MISFRKSMYLDDMVNSLEKLKRLYVHINALIAN